MNIIYLTEMPVLFTLLQGREVVLLFLDWVDMVEGLHCASPAAATLSAGKTQKSVR